ncbi:MAG: hypothetical protein L0229_04145 [Blastocatellia bacterium]|nr:hypothetical protein [Blastocatellia bacterium]
MRKNDAVKAEYVWQEAGLTYTEGGLERLLDPARWSAPVKIDLDLDRDRLVWEQKDPFNFITEGSGMLDQFIKLTDAPPERIRDYARRWGILDVCKHDLPFTHNPAPPHQRYWDWMPNLNRLEDGSNRFCIPVSGLGRESGWGPLEPWRQLSRCMRTLMNIAADIHLEKPGKIEDWRILIEWDKRYSRWKDDYGLLHGHNIFRDEGEKFLDPPKSFNKNKPRPTKAMIEGAVVELACVNFTAFLRRLLDMAGVHVSWVWTTKIEPRTQFRGVGLFGALVMQLMMAVSRTDGFAICSACHEPYIPKRRPRFRQNNYCPKRECRYLAASRVASARYYQKKRENRSES